MAGIRREDGQYMEWQQFGGRIDNRRKGTNTEEGWIINGMAKYVAMFARATHFNGQTSFRLCHPGSF